MATYHRLAESDDDDDGSPNDRKPVVGSDTTPSTDIEMDDEDGDHDIIKEVDAGEEDDEVVAAVLLPRDTPHRRASRTTQLAKVVIMAVIGCFEMAVLPILYGDVDVLWGAVDRRLILTAKLVLYGTFICSCLVAPMLVSMLGVKVTLVLGCITVCLFVAVHFLAALTYLLVPVCVISGFVMGPFVVAQGTFVVNCTRRFCSTLERPDTDAVLGVFNAVFYAVFLAAPLITSGIRLLVLPAESNNTAVTCTRQYCSLIGDGAVMSNPFMFTTNVEDNPTQPDIWYYNRRIEAFLGVSLALSATGLLLAVTVFNSNHPIIVHLNNSSCARPSVEQFPNHSRDSHVKFMPKNQASLLSHFRRDLSRWHLFFEALRDRGLLLVLPLFLFVGMEQATLYNLFIKDIVGCSLGHRSVYLMQMVTSLVSVATTFPVALLLRMIGRLSLSLPTLTVQLSLLLTLFLWQPGLEEWGALYVVAAVWGCADAVWQMKTACLIGRLFSSKKGAAFSHFRLWQIVGVAIVDLLRGVACVDAVLYAFGAVLLVAYATYVVFEIRVRVLLRNGEKPLTREDASINPQRGVNWVPRLDPHERGKRRDLGVEEMCRLMD